MCSGELWNDDQLLEVEAEGDDVFGERGQVVFVAVTGFLDEPVRANPVVFVYLSLGVFVDGAPTTISQTV